MNAPVEIFVLVKCQESCVIFFKEPMYVVHLHVKLRVFVVVKIHTVVFRVDNANTGGSEEHNISVQNIGTLIPDPNGA
jgi:hypothetical protein